MKKYLLLLFALAMVLSLTACEKGPTTAPAATTQPTAPTTLPTTAPTTAPTVPTTAPTEPVHVHTADIWQMDQNQHWQLCAECGEQLNKGPHTLQAGFCTQCNAEIFQSNFDNTTCVYLYDEYGNMTMNQVYDENGTLLTTYTWEYTYDDAGNMLTSTEYEDDFLSMQTKYELDSDGFPYAAMETFFYHDGTKDTTHYDQWGNVTRYVKFGADGLYTLRLSYEYTYDDAGNILYQKDYNDYVLIAETEYKIIETEFGSIPCPVKQIQHYPDGSYLVTRYDDNREVIEEAYYDADGNRIDASGKFDPTVCAPLFGVWESEMLLDGEMMGLGDTEGLEGLEALRIKMTFCFTFYSDGGARIKIAVDMESMRAYTLEVTYASLMAQFGWSREEANTQFQAETGMTIEEYVDMMLADPSVSESLNQQLDMVYYVEGDQLYVGESWSSHMNSEKFTLDGDTLTIHNSSSVVEGAPLEITLTKVSGLSDNAGNFDAEACAPLFGSWSGETVLPTVQTDLPTDVRCQITLTFTEDGQMQCTMVLNRDDVKAATIEKLYQTFEATGMTREDVDAAFMENGGTTIGEAVDAMLDSGASEVQLEQTYTGVYYVADGMIYGGEGWEDEMKPIAFTLDGSTLTLMPENEAPVTLTLDSFVEDTEVFLLPIITANGVSSDMINPLTTGKITILNFWGTWCGPCVNELPHFDQFAKDYAEQVTIIAIHTDSGSENLAMFIQEYYADSPIIFSKDDADFSYYLSWGGQMTFPFTVILDAQGNVLAVYHHSITYAQLEQVIQQTR